MPDKEPEETITDKNTGAETKQRKLQWHPAFGAALEMEFIKEKDSLIFDREHNLNRKPLLIDCLVIKKIKDAVLENEIGKFFKTHNIIEYKSAKDALSIDTVSKVQAYAYLYKAYGESVDKIKFNEITATMMRETKPKALFRYFAENSYKVSNPYRGIYYIQSGFTIPTQIVVGNELNSIGHEWLHLLSDKVTKQEMARVIEYSRGVNNQKERNLIDAVLDVSVAANRDIIEELKRGDEAMCQALMDIMKPEIDAVVNMAVLQERKETTERVEKETTERVEKETAERVEKETAARIIKAAAGMIRSMNISDTEIKEALKKNYGLSEQEALSYLKN